MGRKIPVEDFEHEFSQNERMINSFIGTWEEMPSRLTEQERLFFLSTALLQWSVEGAFRCGFVRKKFMALAEQYWREAHKVVEEAAKEEKLPGLP